MMLFPHVIEISGERESERFFCRVLVIDPLGQHTGGSKIVGYASRRMKSFEIDLPKGHSLEFGIEKDGTGLLTVGRRKYFVYPQPDRQLEHNVHEFTEGQLRRYLDNCLPIA